MALLIFYITEYYIKLGVLAHSKKLIPKGGFMDNKIFEKPNVILTEWLQNPEGRDSEEIAVYGALGCFEEKTALQLFEEDKARLSGGQVKEKLERIFRETSGRGHGSVLDQSCFTFVIENVPRLVTLQLCQPQYLMHLQQSLRRATADRGFFIPDAIKNCEFLDEVVELLYEAFRLYEEMGNAGIPGEDARFVLPLYTKTNIQTTGNARELMHLDGMSRADHIPSVIQETVEAVMSLLRSIAPRKFKDRGMNYEVSTLYPAAQLFAFENKTLKNVIAQYGKADVNLVSKADFPLTEEGVKKAVAERDEAEFANLKHVHYTFLTKMSLSCFHQAIRQRTWDQSVESIYDAVGRGEFVVPPSIQRSDFSSKYEDLNSKLLELCKKLVANGVPQQEAIGVVPHSLTIYDLIHINGWNAIHSIGKRTCTQAQWEIRNLANAITKSIRKTNPVLGTYVYPQGVIYGECPERNSCGTCEKILERLNKD